MFENEAVYSVAIASKILGVKTVGVVFVDSQFLRGKTITSMYLPTHNIILFNQDWLAQAELEEVVLTAFHETRHAYQKAQIDVIPNTQKTENPNTIAVWKREFDQYFRPIDEYQDDPRYVEQEIEKDVFYGIFLLSKNHLLRIDITLSFIV
ncbi:MAG TPA: hypothetical protein DCQ28_13625 [Bacteroidetes bacterium]|nr:hypothetical protein [Bacteroidota bacterium]